MIEKALLRWGVTDAALLLHTVLRCWSDHVVRERDLDAGAARLAAEERVRDEHKQKVAWVLLSVGVERCEVHQRLFFFRVGGS